MIRDELEECRKTTAAVIETVTRRIREAERAVKALVRQRIADDEDHGRETLQSWH
jgi:hypothetical protein